MNIDLIQIVLNIASVVVLTAMLILTFPYRKVCGKEHRQWIPVVRILIVLTLVRHSSDLLERIANQGIIR